MNIPTDEGRKLNEFVAAARQLMHDLSSLLLTADSLMASDDWTPASGSYCNEGVSANVHIPQGWFPKDLFRFYEGKVRNSNVLAVIAVSLFRHNDAVRELEEPLITATWFDYGAQAIGEKKEGWQIWYARWHMYFPATDHGTWANQWVSDLPKSDLAENRYQFSRARSLTEPLVRVSTADLLKELLVRRLFEDMRTNAGTEREKV